jgi:hypothetical protein
MDGGAMVLIRGCTINANRYGWPTQPLRITARGFIHLDRRLSFREHRQPALLWMMADLGLTKRPMNVGMILLQGVPKAA